MNTKQNILQNNIESLYQNLESKRLAINNENSSLWLNLGYWKSAHNTQEACINLIKLFVEFSELKDYTKILDVGFGYGMQDVLIANMLPNCEIDGVNIVKHQVDTAQQLVEQNNLKNRVNLFSGNANELQYNPSTFDFVIAIESAFHFNTRELFFNEAYKALKPGGTLCLADFATSIPIKNNASFVQRCKHLGIPLENQYEMDEYIEKLKIAGFIDINYIDISKYVIPFASVMIKNNEGWRGNLPKEMPESIMLEKQIQEFKISTTIDKYFIIKATKV
jgi:microcystin synthetase protein McyJ